MKKVMFGVLGLAALSVAAYAALAKSGLEVGETVTPFHPTHFSGPDKGTDTCPPCKYGNRPAVMVWVNTDDTENITRLSRALSTGVNNNEDLKAFMIFMANCEMCVESFQQIGKETRYTNIGMAHVMKTDAAVKNYKINTDSSVKNTVLVYKNRQVVEKFVNFEATPENVQKLNAAIAKVVQ